MSRDKKRLVPFLRVEHTPHKAFRIGRNEPCPCGSGKKYKHCHEAKVRVDNPFRIKQ